MLMNCWMWRKTLPCPLPPVTWLTRLFLMCITPWAAALPASPLPLWMGDFPLLQNSTMRIAPCLYLKSRCLALPRCNMKSLLLLGTCLDQPLQSAQNLQSRMVTFPKCLFRQVGPSLLQLNQNSLKLSNRMAVVLDLFQHFSPFSSLERFPSVVCKVILTWYKLQTFTFSWCFLMLQWWEQIMLWYTYEWRVP